MILSRKRAARVLEKSSVISSDEEKQPLFHFDDIRDLIDDFFDEKFDQHEINEIANIWENIDSLNFVQNFQNDILDSKRDS